MPGRRKREPGENRLFCFFTVIEYFAAEAWRPNPLSTSIFVWCGSTRLDSSSPFGACLFIFVELVVREVTKFSTTTKRRRRRRRRMSGERNKSSAGAGGQPSPPTEGGEGGRAFPVEVDEASIAQLGNQLKDLLRKAMRDLIEEEVNKGEYAHILRLWKEIQVRLLRLSSSSKQEREKTMAAIDCDYAQELVESKALDNNILADMIQLCSQRLAQLGAVAYESQVLNWGIKLADKMRSPETQSPADILAQFFDTSDTLLTRIEAGVAAHLLCQAMTAYPGPSQ